MNSAWKEQELRAAGGANALHTVLNHTWSGQVSTVDVHIVYAALETTRYLLSSRCFDCSDAITSVPTGPPGRVHAAFRMIWNSCTQNKAIST
jgi:hypothetical protein